MKSATIGGKSAASCLNRLQRPFDAASARCRQTEALPAGGGSRTEGEAAPRAAHTAVALRAGGRCGTRLSCSPSAGLQQLAEPVGPPSQPKAAPSPAVSLGLTAGAEVLALLLRPHHQVTPARPVTCTTRGPAGWADSSPDDTPGHVRSGLDPPTRPGHGQDPSCIFTGQITRDAFWHRCAKATHGSNRDRKGPRTSVPTGKPRCCGPGWT